MTAQPHRYAFENPLPPATPTLMQLAGKVLEAQAAFRRVNHHVTPDAEWNKAMYAEQEAAAAFFDALDQQIGIDRDVFLKLAELA